MAVSKCLGLSWRYEFSIPERIEITVPQRIEEESLSIRII